MKIVLTVVIKVVLQVFKKKPIDFSNVTVSKLVAQ